MDDRQLLKNFLRNITGLPTLKEQDDDPFAADDEGGDEEEAEEPAEDAGGDEEEPEGEGEEKKEEPKQDPSPDAGKDDSLDGELSAIFVDIESRSMKQESKSRYSLSYHLLNEQDSGATLDLDKFAEETARIFRNVEAFLDIDEIILKKAEQFVTDNHGADQAEQLLNILRNRYNIVRKEESEKAELDIEKSVPIAVGASGGSGA